VDQGRFQQAVSDLCATDDALGAVVAEHGVPALWTRPEGFPTLVLLVLEQQVSLASAAAAYRRLDARLGGVRAEALLRATPEDLRADGVSRQKDRYLRALATSVLDGALDLTALRGLGDDDVRASLTTVPGIGRWTADVYLLACLGRPDVWPVGDRALQVATAEALGLAEVPSAPALDEVGDRWRPQRSTAARLLWHGYLARRGRQGTPSSLLG
jgi:DNA-3-methyladenine glycosylase II